MKRLLGVHIRPEHAGMTTLDFVAGRFTYRSREGWQQELAAGRFVINDRPVHDARLLAAGDHLVYLLAELEEPPVACDFTVLFEDRDLLVVDKPAPLPCHPGGRFFHHTLWTLLREKHNIAEPLLVNRLDRETSGLVVAAKHKEAARAIGRQFAERQVDKVYQVVVEGRFPEIEIRAMGRLAPDPRSVVRKKVRFYPAGDGAPTNAPGCATVFRRLACHNGLSLLEAKPLTGRCHQIRATLCSLGFPVVGDKLYGVDENFFIKFMEDRLTPADRRRLRIDRQALHAAALTLKHPATGRELRVDSPLPSALSNLLS